MKGVVAAAFIVRHLMTGVGMVLLDRGMLSSQDEVEMFSGGVAIAVGLAWSWFQKKGLLP